MRVYGDRRSGNCLKIKYTADFLGLPYEWQDVDIMAGETRTEAYLARNPAGQVPMVEFEDGRILTQSNAIICYLAEGSDLMPTDRFAKAEMLSYMFYEQYSHEPYIAVCRFQKLYLGKSDDELDPEKRARGNAALGYLENRLQDRPYLVGDRISLADISLVAYTRLAPEGGFDLEPYAAVRAWIARVETDLNI
jgi:glutathione S-transferase